MSEHLSHQTRDHNKIRHWIEERGGRPAMLEGTGLLRVKFRESQENESLQEVGWEDFFRSFEENELCFLYQDEVRGGEESRFSKFVNRH